MGLWLIVLSLVLRNSRHSLTSFYVMLLVANENHTDPGGGVEAGQNSAIDLWCTRQLIPQRVLGSKSERGYAVDLHTTSFICTSALFGDRSKSAALEN